MQVIAGFGFRGSAGLDSLRDALHRTAQSHRLTALATPADKAEAACLRALANDLNLPVIAVTAEKFKPTQNRQPQPHAYNSCARQAAWPKPQPLAQRARGHV